MFTEIQFDASSSRRHFDDDDDDDDAMTMMMLLAGLCSFVFVPLLIMYVN
jgi:hypothetical protein